MARWAVFLRGVNVGGHGKLPMAELRKALTAIGAQNVATYIQSGNIVMDHSADHASAVADAVTGLIAAEFGFRPHALALSADTLWDLIRAVPQPPTLDPKHIHVYLSDGDLPPDLSAELAPYCTQGEEIVPLPRALAILAPQGIGRSKLTAPLERRLKNKVTARNLNSLRKVLTMLETPT